jgi:hypothetical protein
MSFRLPGDPITDEQLLAEIDDIMRSMPPENACRKVEWTGRAAAALTRWDMARSPTINSMVDDMAPTSSIVRHSCRQLNCSRSSPISQFPCGHLVVFMIDICSSIVARAMSQVLHLRTERKMLR